MRSPAAAIDGLRIGIQCVRVNRFPTKGLKMAEIERIIRGREQEQERLMLKFVNTSKVGLNGFSSLSTDHGFVINPMAGKKGQVAVATFDMEEGGGDRAARGAKGKLSQGLKGIASTTTDSLHKLEDKTKTKEQIRLEKVAKSEALSRDAVNAFEIEGSSNGPAIVERWTPT